MSQNDSPKDNLPKLAELARQAFEQRRTKECLDLTRAILLIDPEHKAAQSMRSSIQSEMQRDLDKARSFIRAAQAKEAIPQTVASDEVVSVETQPETVLVNDLPVCGSAADTPPLEEGTANVKASHSPPWLRRGGRDSNKKAAKPPLMERTGWFVQLPIIRWFERTTPSAPTKEASQHLITAQPPLLNQGGDWRRRTGRHRSRAGSWTAAVVLAVALVAVDLPRSRTDSTFSPTTPSDVAEASLAPAALESYVKTTSAEPSKRRPAAIPSAVPAIPAEPPSPAPTATGMLAVSSATPVDIYKDDTYLGSAPASLELPAGSQTIEYRHGDLRKHITYVINSNETTKTTITFDTSLQINSRPWAEVSVDGIEKKALGQTPLSDVRVPIGSLLIFENPEFPPKKYRVTGNETGIQNVFP